MRTLFVCRANVGRSQTGMEFYNRRFPGQADSAGTRVDKPGEQLRERPGAKNVVTVMKDYGIDMSDNRRQEIKQEALARYDQIIVIAEPTTIPAWLATNPKIKIWEIQDPKDQSIAFTRDVVSEIKNKVDSLD